MWKGPPPAPLTEQRTTNGITKTTTYTYNFDGSIAALQYPASLRTITYTPGGAGRSLSAVDTPYSINYATAAHYTPAGALTSLTNGANLSSTYLYNPRLQPCWMYATTGTPLPWNSQNVNCTTADPGPGNVLDLQYNFSLGLADNGNVMQIANNRDTTRTQNFSYDALDRIGTAYTSGNLWGETFQIDSWGNLNKILAYSGKPQPENLNQMAGNNDRFTGMSYGAAGNLLNDGASTYFYDAESRIQTGAGVTYTYDGDGKRVQKSTGKLYWYGMGSDPLDESDASGNMTNEYIFFGGKRIARRDSSSNVFYYFADHLDTAREIIQAGQTSPCYDADFYPFGGERVVTNTCPQNYKFTSKERDSESGLDFMGARYYGSALGRFVQADPLFVEIQRLADPQQLNLYQYARNNPLTFTDPTGLDVKLNCGTKENCRKAVIELNNRKDRQFKVELGKDGKLHVVKGSVQDHLSKAEGALLGAVNDPNNHATINVSGNTGQSEFGLHDGPGVNSVDLGNLSQLDAASNAGGLNSGDVIAHEAMDAYYSLSMGATAADAAAGGLFPGLLLPTNGQLDIRSGSLFGQTTDQAIVNGSGTERVSMQYVTPIPLQDFQGKTAQQVQEKEKDTGSRVTGVTFVPPKQ